MMRIIMLTLAAILQNPWATAMVLTNSDSQSSAYASLLQEEAPDVITYQVANTSNTNLLIVGAHQHELPRKILLASMTAVAVLYPDLPEPQGSPFAQIIKGIEAEARVPVISIPISRDFSLTQLNNTLADKQVDLVISLGRYGYSASKKLRPSITRVVAAITSIPEKELEGTNVFTLSPAPELLFAQLRKLKPEIRRVMVAYDPSQNSWIIKLAKQAASKHGLTLQTIEVNTHKAAVQTYQEFFNTSNPDTDAIWMLQDSLSAEANIILPYVLNQAWIRSIVVFSNTVEHVQRGALFAAYPNNLEMGKQIMLKSRDGFSDTQKRATIRPLTEAWMSINVRTAKHLQINIDMQNVKEFRTFYPQ